MFQHIVPFGGEYYDREEDDEAKDSVVLSKDAWTQQHFPVNLLHVVLEEIKRVWRE